MSDTLTPAPEPSAPSAPFESDGYTIESNTRTADEIRATFTEEKAKNGDAEPEAKEAKVDISKAASELGKKGGAAAAKARKAEQKAEGADGDAGVAGADAGAGVSEPAEGEAEGVSEEEALEGIRSPDIKERIRTATRKEAEAKRLLRQRDAELQQRDVYIAQLRAEAEQRRPQPQEAPPQREAPGAEEPPKEEDFEDYKDFVRATARFEAREAYRQEQAQMRAQAEVDAYAAQIDGALRSFNGRVREAFGDEMEERVPAWPAEIQRQFGLESACQLLPSVMVPDGHPISPENVIADEIVSSEQAPALIMYLAEHPDVFQRLATLHSYQSVQREMAKLEAKVEAATAGNPAPIKAVSKAKPPVRPVTGSPHTADEFSPDLSYDDHVRMMNARERRR